MPLPVVLLVVAAVLHLGFQLTVTALVYPALAGASPGQWRVVHAGHSRRIVPLVVVTYGLLLLALGWAVLAGPRTAWLGVAGAGAALAFLVTAAAAAPTHGRLAAGRDDALVARLLRVDRWRSVGAAVTVVGAVGWALTA
ncbi:MAG: hypothetical protein M3Y71_15660 [Actinomycetota bacterium]|nr:hypothetical protein [Actinomycetota bacterium]